MFFWILTIFCLKDKLRFYADKLDKDAMNEALNLCNNTVRAYENILLLNEKKAGVVNLKVMADRMISNLDAKELFVIESFAKGTTLDDIACVLGQHKSTSLRMLKRIVIKCEAVLESMNIRQETLEKEYKSYAPVYARFVRMKRKRVLDEGEDVKQITNYNVQITNSELEASV